MSTTAKQRVHPWSIIFCFIIILITEFHLGNIPSYLEIFQSGLFQASTNFSPLPTNNMEISSLFFWHFAWLGSILSICGLVGIWVAFNRVENSINKINHLTTKKDFQEHIPVHG